MSYTIHRIPLMPRVDVHRHSIVYTSHSYYCRFGTLDSKFNVNVFLVAGHIVVCFCFSLARMPLEKNGRPWVLAEFPDEIEEDDAIFRIRFTGEVCLYWKSLM